MPQTYYISDPHWNHRRVCEHRRFSTLEGMNLHMQAKFWLFVLERTNGVPLGPPPAFDWQLVWAGDMAMNWRKFSREYGKLAPGQPAPTKKQPWQLHRVWHEAIRERSILVAGNHDQIRKQQKDYDAHFHQIVGTEKTFEENTIVLMDQINGQQAQVLVSHVPQRNLQGCDFNVHGHVHAWEAGHHDECYWARESPQHLNCCVELTDYTPRTLTQLIRLKALDMERAA